MNRLLRLSLVAAALCALLLAASQFILSPQSLDPNRGIDPCRVLSSEQLKQHIGWQDSEPTSSTKLDPSDNSRRACTLTSANGGVLNITTWIDASGQKYSELQGSFAKATSVNGGYSSDVTVEGAQAAFIYGSSASLIRGIFVHTKQAVVELDNPALSNLSRAQFSSLASAAIKHLP